VRHHERNKTDMTPSPLPSAGNAELAAREDLFAAARVAPSLAATHCRPQDDGHSCAWYHGSWPVLRALGAINSPGSDDDFLLRALADGFARGARRVLVSGAADAGMLARVTSVLPCGRDVRITVLDRCRTPLELGRRHAEALGMSIDTVCADILDHEADGEYDLICTHSFLTFFPPEARRRLLRRWWRLLRTGGSVVTAQRVRPGESAAITRFLPEDIARLADAAERGAQTFGDYAGVDPAQARALALGYGERHHTYLIVSSEELQSLFLAAGFRLEEFAPPPEERQRLDRSGAPANAHSGRWRILAAKP
jgi:2-polyprenyl-3-methyl-5-hydroxy-6-metoxy-1,4-benzoquinol methylase